MAKNYVEDGHTMDWTNDTGGDVVSGDAVVLGSVTGVAHGDIADGEEGVLHMTGVFSLPKDAADAWDAGQKLYLGADGNITATEGDVLAGTAWAESLPGDEQAVVRLGY